MSTPTVVWHKLSLARWGSCTLCSPLFRGVTVLVRAAHLKLLLGVLTQLSGDSWVAREGRRDIFHTTPTAAPDCKRLSRSPFLSCIKIQLRYSGLSFDLCSTGRGRVLCSRIGSLLVPAPVEAFVQAQTCHSFLEEDSFGIGVTSLSNWDKLFCSSWCSACP